MMTLLECPIKYCEVQSKHQMYSFVYRTFTLTSEGFFVIERNVLPIQ